MSRQHNLDLKKNLLQWQLYLITDSFSRFHPKKYVTKETIINYQLVFKYQNTFITNWFYSFNLSQSRFQVRYDGN